MARLVGIDVRGGRVRVAVLQSQYRGFKLLAFRQAPVVAGAQVEDALREVVAPLLVQGDHVCCCLTGAQLFVRDIALPATAAKQLADVVPYEVEARVPLDFDELCFDYRLLPRARGADTLDIVAAAARLSDVREIIERFEQTTGSEPERVGAGALPLGNLALVVPDLRGPEPVAVLDLSPGTSDLVVLVDGRPVFARTLSVGVDSGADALVAALRQSRAAWLQRSRAPFGRLFLTGMAAGVDGAATVLSEALDIEVLPLPPLGLEGGNDVPGALVGFEKAIASALGTSAGALDLNLRQGPLAYQHSYEFLKTKLPLLGSLAAAIILSFAFSVWARSRSLDAEFDSQTAALGALTEQRLGERIEVAEDVLDRIDRAGAAAGSDPQPKMDAFSVLVAVSESISENVIHDIEEFDVQGEKVRLVGLLSATGEAEQIAEVLGGKPCFSDVKISKITKVVKVDRQKYSLTFSVDCGKAKATKQALAVTEKGGR